MSIKLCICVFFLPFLCSAQQPTQENKPAQQIIVPAVIYEGDTIPCITMPAVMCTAKRTFKNKKDAAKWTRLLYNVKKVYPYSILAAARLKEYDRILATIPNEKDRKKYMSVVEEKLKAEFGNDLKNLTITQGKILIKLIDRETGKNSYTLIKELRGSFSAFMWQSLATLFNSNLKVEYDPEGEDKMIEDAIKLIESGAF
jgi:hypothetical protein